MTYITSTQISGDDAAQGYRAILDALPTTQPEGLLARYAGSSDDGFVVTAVWTSQAAWNRFATEMLGPAVGAVISSDGDGTAHTVEYEAEEEFVAGVANRP